MSGGRPADPVRVLLDCGHRTSVARDEYGDGSIYCNACADFKVYARCLTCGSLDCQASSGPTLAHEETTSTSLERPTAERDELRDHKNALAAALAGEYARAEAAEARCERLTEVLEDEIVMAEQSVETLRNLHDNWERIIDERDDDGDPLIENILYWLIDDVTPINARAALADTKTQSLRHSEGDAA